MGNSMLIKVLVMAAFAVLLGGHQVFVAGSEGKSAAPPSKQDEALPGSTVSLDDAAKKADIIVVATISRAQVDHPSRPGAAYYEAEILITKLLKGKTKDTKLSVQYTVVSIPDKEVAPKEKDSYIFFIKGDKPEKGKSLVNLHAIKILADTESNREAVAKALAPQIPKPDGKPEGKAVSP